MTDEEVRGITRAEIKPAHPVQARWALGRKKPGDIIWTTDTVPLLVSEHVVSMLRDEGFTGWSTYDVNLVGHDGTPLPGYHGLSIYGRCGPVDEDKAMEVPRIYPGGIFPVWLGLYFDPDTWDGSDLFMPEHPRGAKFVTQEVKQAFENAKIKNVYFKSLRECEVFKLREPAQATVR